MPFTLIRGTFHASNYSPDGDSIRFHPEQPSLLATLPGAKPRINSRGHVQLRLEGIDTLETHYAPTSGGGSFHQPLALGVAARNALLRFTNITDVVWSSDGGSVVSANDGSPGYILTREIEKNGRAVAFLFSGTAPEGDGSSVTLDPTRLYDSYNYFALREGLAFATFYTGLFADLRTELAAAAASARAGRSGIHADDVTTTGFSVTSLAALTDQYVMLPKLFRRLVAYLSSTGTVVGFKEMLAEAREPVLDLQTANFTHFDTFIEQAPGSSEIRLTRAPEDLVFGPMLDRPLDPFALALILRANLVNGLVDAAAGGNA